MTLACEDGNSKLLEIVTVADVDAEERVDDSLVHIWSILHRFTPFHTIFHLCYTIVTTSIKPVLTYFGAKCPPEFWSWGNMSPF